MPPETTPETSTNSLTTSDPTPTTQITTLIFDVDDTLYDVSTGFTHHRNTYGATSFMMSHLHFTTLESATSIRNQYFRKYHSTVKALTIAEKEGKLPPTAPPFDPAHLAEWWATKLDFSLLGERDDAVVDMLRSSPLKLVAFSNGPRRYVVRVLRQLGLYGDGIFGEDAIFAVDDVLPHCKPEVEAFQKVFDEVGVVPEECVMVEDSMKNIRNAKRLGMKTILVTGKRGDAAEEVETTKMGDAPDVDDECVDASVECVGRIRSELAGLWENPVVFGSGSIRR